MKNSVIKHFSRCFFYYTKKTRVRCTVLKKYEKLLILPAMIVIVAVFLSGYKEQSCVRITESLLEERTTILQQAYLGRLKNDDAERYLSRIETYPLLTEDVQALRESQETDFDPVKAMEILEIRQDSKHFRYLTLFVRIRWHLSGPDSDYVSENDYTVVLKSTSNGFLLSQFEPS